MSRKDVRGSRGRFAEDPTYRHRYEERIIMRDVEAMTAGGNREVSTKRLRLFAPMRYGRYLKHALSRLHAQGHLRLRSRSPTRGNIYVPVEDLAAEREAA